MPKPPPPTLTARQELLAPTGPPPLSDARVLDVRAIDPNPQQARQQFADLDELTASVKEVGIVQPLVVRPTADGRYELVVGERRYRAALAADLGRVPALVRDLTDAEAAILTATENLQRADLDLEDEARQFARLLIITDLSQRALAGRLGVKHDYVSRRVRLLDRPALFARIRSGELTLDAALKELSAPPADPPPDPPERTELQPVNFVASRYSPAPAAFAPYTARAFSRAYSAVHILAGTDPASVPPGERPAVRQRLTELQQVVAAWLSALDAPADTAPDWFKQ